VNTYLKYFHQLHSLAGHSHQTNFSLYVGRLCGGCKEKHTQLGR